MTWPRNAWVGTTIDNQEWADGRFMLDHVRVLVGDTPGAPTGVSDTDRVMQAAREGFRSEPFSQSQIAGVTGRQFLGRPDALGQALRDGVRQELLRELPEARTGGRSVVKFQLSSL